MSSWSVFITVVTYGLLLGVMYGGISLGLSLIYGVLRLSNFAQGAMLMTSCFLFYIFQYSLNMHLALAALITIPVMFGIGFIVQYFCINRLLRRERASTVSPVSSMLFTFGLWFFFENLFTMIYGTRMKTITGPFHNMYVDIVGTSVPLAQLLGLIGTVILTVGLVLFLRKTEMGKQIRSVSQNRTAAALCGINVYKVYAVTFGIGIALVSVSGLFLSQYYPINPIMGANFSVRAIMIVVLGGLGSIPGALCGGLIFGLAETFLSQLMPTALASMFSFLIFVLILIFRPQGLFGKKAL